MLDPSTLCRACTHLSKSNGNALCTAICSAASSYAMLRCGNETSYLFPATELELATAATALAMACEMAVATAVATLQTQSVSTAVTWVARLH